MKAQVILSAPKGSSRTRVSHPPSALVFCKAFWVAYPELHNHGMQRGSQGHHHGTRSQVLIHSSADIPEVQVVPWQQTGSEERFTKEEGDLVTRAESRTQVSEVLS
jgi:hypothetical protein